MEQSERKFIVDSEGETKINTLTEQEKALYNERKANEKSGIIKEERDRLAKLGPEDTASEWIEDVLKIKPSYSETLLIESDGSINTEMRADKIRPSSIVFGVGLKNTEDLYSHLHKISQKYPQYQFSFEI